MANGVIIPNPIKLKIVEIGGSSGSHNTTAVNFGNIATLTGITGLNDRNIVSIEVINTILSPASILLASLYNNDLYIAASQSCTRSSTISLKVTYNL